MKTIADLLKLLENGAKPVVEFGANIAEQEVYAEKGMRARALHFLDDGDDVVRVTFDYGEFEAHNLPLEPTHYFDTAGNPTLTARQAGFYRPQDAVYFDRNQSLENMLALVSGDRVALYAQYIQSASQESYISWLESKVLAGAPQ
jgi:hypothetical protein